MLSQKQIINILKKEFPYIASEYGVKRIGLFGSYAKNIQREESDIDILVEFEKPIGFKFMRFGEFLEKLLGKKTDILTTTGVNGIRIKRVVKDIEESLIFV